LFEREFRVLSCRKCGLIFVADHDRDHKKYYAEEYDYRLSADGHFVDDEKLNGAIFDWVVKHFSQTRDTTLAEIGCSAGFLLKRFHDHGVNVFGVEPGKKAVEFANKVNGLQEIVCGMLEDVEVDRSFDAVILIQTFEHMAHPLDSLSKVKGLLKDDGLLFIEVPNYYAPNGFYLLKIQGVDCPSPNHLFVYTRKTLSAFLIKAGFSIQETSYTLQNLRVVAKVNGSDACIEFENYRKVMLYARVLPLITKAINAARFLKGKLARTS
jgi:2-polyprenyl-3-methyl-5-hydroxy-6-metoxy-1,4-benzoquinol methylase